MLTLTCEDFSGARKRNNEVRYSDMVTSDVYDDEGIITGDTRGSTMGGRSRCQNGRTANYKCVLVALLKKWSDAWLDFRGERRRVTEGHPARTKVVDR